MEKEDESFKKFLQFILDNAETPEGKAIVLLDYGALKRAKFDNVSGFLANFKQWKDDGVVRKLVSAWKESAEEENLYAEEESCLVKKLKEAKKRASEPNQAKASDSASESSSDASELSNLSIFKSLLIEEGSADDNSSSKASAGNMTYSDDNSSTHRSIVQSLSFENDLMDGLLYLLGLVGDDESLKKNFLDGNMTAKDVVEALKGMKYTNTDHHTHVFSRLEKLDNAHLAAYLTDAFGSNPSYLSSDGSSSGGTEIGSI